MDNTKEQLRLEQEFEYYHNKVEQMEQERETDRSWDSQRVIRDHKKMKLRLKDQLHETYRRTQRKT